MKSSPSPKKGGTIRAKALSLSLIVILIAGTLSLASSLSSSITTTNLSFLAAIKEAVAQEEQEGEAAGEETTTTEEESTEEEVVEEQPPQEEEQQQPFEEPTTQQRQQEGFTSDVVASADDNGAAFYEQACGGHDLCATIQVTSFAEGIIWDLRDISSPSWMFFSHQQGNPAYAAYAYNADAAPPGEYTVIYERFLVSCTNPDPELCEALAVPQQSTLHPNIPQNNPPIANAGPDDMAAPGDLVTLSGSASRDPEGKPLTYQWTQTAGTSVDLSNPTGAVTTFTAPEIATTSEVLTFELKVTDQYRLTDTDTVDITVTECTPENIQAARQYFENNIAEWSSRGWAVAASNLQDFVEGTGANPKEINSDWVRSFREVLAGEKRIQGYFENGATGSTDQGVRQIAPSVGAGQTVNHPTSGTIEWEAAITGNPRGEFFWAIGHAELFGDGAFKLTRNGNKVTVTGLVNFNLHDIYNFNEGQPGYEEAEILKKCANAKDYPIESYWTMGVSGTLSPNGSGKLTWTLL